MIEIIKENIKNELKDRNIKVKDLCKELRVGKNYINYMTDEVKLNKIVDIANHIGCKAEDLIIGIN